MNTTPSRTKISEKPKQALWLRPFVFRSWLALTAFSLLGLGSVSAEDKKAEESQKNAETGLGTKHRSPKAKTPTGKTLGDIYEGSARLNLNEATQKDLENLPGIGPSRAEALLALRDRLGGFRKIQQILRVKGIGRATFRKLQPLIRVRPKGNHAKAKQRNKSEGA